LRLEIAFKIDKKKNEKKEFNFSSRTKILLTRKEKRACPRKTKISPQSCSYRSDQSTHIAMGATPDLTELTRARNFSTFGVPLGCRPNAGEAHQK